MGSLTSASLFQPLALWLAYTRTDADKTAVEHIENILCTYSTSKPYVEALLYSQMAFNYISLCRFPYIVFITKCT